MDTVNLDAQLEDVAAVLNDDYTDSREHPTGPGASGPVATDYDNDTGDDDGCNNEVSNGSYYSPPEYCGNDTEPGEEYCTPCKKKIEALERFEAEQGLS
jgi:hypothetical protein